MQLSKPLNKYIDHTLLKPTATHDEFEDFLDGAVKYQFASVCVSPYMAAPVKAALVGEDIAVGTVVSFPHGNLPLTLKLKEIEYHGINGIDEVDIVINYADLKAGNYDSVGHEVKNLSDAAKGLGLISKCIIETCYLSMDEISFMFKLLYDHTEIDYIKTSTGFGSENAQLIDVLNWNASRSAKVKEEESNLNLIQLLPHVGGDARTTPLKIKASGGIKDLVTALKFIAAGADRLGTSSGVKVMEEFNEQSSTFTAGEEKTG